MTMTSGKVFRVFGDIVRGAAHITQDKPCQDALYMKDETNFIIACVADGHGSSRCPYSADGAKAAVETAAVLLTSILENNDEAFANLSAHKEIWLPKQLEERWKTHVKELHKKRTVDFTYELYGTTLLALAVTQSFVFALQIGDGDILTISPHMRTDWLIPPVESVGSETESLCMENSWQCVRTRILPYGNIAQPFMFLLSTDGYANSFTETSGFVKAGEDIFNLWREEGAAYVKDNLRDWLTRSTAEGSGDDITVALVMREV
jgi:serine/threonine protein phosphatase PrpC